MHDSANTPSLASPGNPLRIEMANFWFGPTRSGRVALISCALFGGDPFFEGSIGEALAREALEERSSWFGSLTWRQERPVERSACATLIHRQILVEGREAIHLSYGFMHRLSHAALSRGIQACVCPAYWAACESSLDPAHWPNCEARAMLDHAEIQHSLAAAQEMESTHAAQRPACRL